KVGTEYHAAWSPYIDLDNGWPTVTYGADAGQIIAQCPTPIVIDYNDVVYILGRAGNVDEKCGTDPSTLLPVRVVATRTTRITAASASYSGKNSRYSSWTSASYKITKNGCGTTGCTEQRQVTIIDENNFSITGGATVRHEGIILSSAPIKVTYSSSTDDMYSPVVVNIGLGVLDDDDKGKQSQVFKGSFGIGSFISKDTGARVNFYSNKSYTSGRVTYLNAEAWFDRFTLSKYRWEAAGSNCEYRYWGSVQFPEPGAQMEYVGWGVGTLADFGAPTASSTEDVNWIKATSAEPSKIYVARYMFGDSTDEWGTVCMTSRYDTGVLSDKDQNIVAPHYLKYRRFS
ncbi:hypothetical protein R7283_004910, partial [Salmonella enterica]|nr:hypothetical protein [Salmonella enterica]